MKSIYCEAVLFDLDGVLVNSNACVERHWRMWAQQHGLDIEAILQISHGRPTVETMRLMAPHLCVEEEARTLDRRAASDLVGVVEVVGVSNLLATVPTACWAIVTSGDRVIATNRLRHVGLPLPQVLITSEDVVHGKPDPEGYLKAAKQLGVSPEKCLVIEDAIAGVKAARAARMQVIAVTTTYPASQLSDADASISAMTEIALGQHRTSEGRTSLEILLAAQ
ncbi:MAG: HAD-IA family hydrolase [Cyanobacteriota bacterium]